jgi:hypothetical protein
MCYSNPCLFVFSHDELQSEVTLFRMKLKVVHVGTEKIVTLYHVQVYVKKENFSFNFIDAGVYAVSEK